MVIILNGSFGVGKTTVARLLRASWPNSVIYDPEWLGLALMRLPRSITGWRTDDFQDIRLWRASVVKGVRLFRLLAPTVIVPMTFSNHDYFAAIVAGIRRFEPELKPFCLQAGLPTIRERLATRGTDNENQWISRRIVECEAAFRSGYFGETVATEQLSAVQVADIIKTAVNK